MSVLSRALASGGACPQASSRPSDVRIARAPLPFSHLLHPFLPQVIRLASIMLKCTFDPSNQYDDPAFRYPVQEALDELMRSDSPQLTADGSVPAVRRRIVQTGNFTHYLTVPSTCPLSLAS